MCKCLDAFPSWVVLFGELTDELVELIQAPLDPKEWSDVGRGFERLVEKSFNRRGVINLGGGLNRRVQAERLATQGCIRSPRKFAANGNKCLSE